MRDKFHYIVRYDSKFGSKYDYAEVFTSLKKAKEFAGRLSGMRYAIIREPSVNWSADRCKLVLKGRNERIKKK